MDDGTIVDTDLAKQFWIEKTRWNGRNHISLVTGDQWLHETLYQTKKGRYYIEFSSDWQGSTPSAEWVTDKEALSWLLKNEYDKKIPEDLKKLVEEVLE
jgi:hypothetical protein